MDGPPIAERAGTACGISCRREERDESIVQDPVGGEDLSATGDRSPRLETAVPPGSRAAGRGSEAPAA